MEPITTSAAIAAAVPAALSLGTSALSYFTGNREAGRNRRFNAAEAQKARDYNTQMSNTQAQRHADDLEAAGLNRILAVNPNGGSAPSSPAASHSGPAPSLQFDTSALQVGAQNRLLKAQAAQATSNADLAKIDAQTRAAQNVASLDETIARIDKTMAETSLTEEARKNKIEERANLLELRNQIIANTSAIKTSERLTSAKTLTEQENKRGKQIENKKERAWLPSEEEKGKQELDAVKYSLPRQIGRFFKGGR